MFLESPQPGKSSGPGVPSRFGLRSAQSDLEFGIEKEEKEEKKETSVIKSRDPQLAAKEL